MAGKPVEVGGGVERAGGERGQQEQETAGTTTRVHSKAWLPHQHLYCASESSSTAALAVSAGPGEEEESCPVGCLSWLCLCGLCASGDIPPPMRLSLSQLEEAGKLLLPKYLFSLCTEAGTKAQKSLLQSSVWCGTWEPWEIVEPKIERQCGARGMCDQGDHGVDDNHPHPPTQGAARASPI